MRRALATGALGLALGLAAWAFDAEPLLPSGPALVALALVAAGWVRLAARGASIERHVAAPRVVEDEPLSVRIVARAGRVPFPGAEVAEPLLGAPAPLPPGRAVARLRIEVRFARRGWHELAAPRLAVRDPLGLATRSVAAAGDDRVLVLPRTEALSAPPGGGSETAARGPRSLLTGGAEVEMDGLRPYRSGAPATRIHWPAVARGAGLLERRLRPDADSRPLVVLDADGEEAAVDAAVRAAASLALALARPAGCDVLLPGARAPATLDPGLRAWPAIHARLALVPAGRGPAALATAGRAAAVVYVAARPPAGLVTRLPGGGPRVLVVPTGAAPARRALFTVAGCVGLDVAGGARREAA